MRDSRQQVPALACSTYSADPNRHRMHHIRRHNHAPYGVSLARDFQMSLKLPAGAGPRKPEPRHHFVPPPNVYQVSGSPTRRHRGGKLLSSSPLRVAPPVSRAAVPQFACGLCRHLCVNGTLMDRLQRAQGYCHPLLSHGFAPVDVSAGL